MIRGKVGDGPAAGPPRGARSDPDSLPGSSRPLATVGDDDIDVALETLWGTTAVNIWNARRATVGKGLGWCSERPLRTSPAARVGSCRPHARSASPTCATPALCSRCDGGTEQAAGGFGEIGFQPVRQVRRRGMATQRGIGQIDDRA